MIIADILFYLQCVEQLSVVYNKRGTKEPQKKVIENMLKVWLFYKSSNKVFWTHMTTKLGRFEEVKEHQYSNLSSIKYILSSNKKMHNPLFGDKDTLDKIADVLKFMQWNYTGSSENRRLVIEQDYLRFYQDHKGNPLEAYKSAKVDLELAELKLIKNDLSENFLFFFNNDYKFIVELEIKKKVRLKRFVANYKKIDRDKILEFGNQQVIILGQSMSEVARNIAISLFSTYSINEFKQYLLKNKYLVNKGPFSSCAKDKYSIEIFDKPSKYFVTMQRKSAYNFQLINKTLDFCEGSFHVFDRNFKLVFPVID